MKIYQKYKGVQNSIQIIKIFEWKLHGDFKELLGPLPGFSEIWDQRHCVFLAKKKNEKKYKEFAYIHTRGVLLYLIFLLNWLYSILCFGE